MNRRGGIRAVLWAVVLAASLIGLAGCGDGNAVDGAFEADLTASYPESDAVALFAPVVVEVELLLPPGVTSAFEPAVPDGFAGEVSTLEDQTGERGSRRRWRLDLVAQQPGALTIPAMRATAGDEVVTTAPWSVTVRSLLDEGDSGDLVDPAPQFEEPEPVWPWVLGAAGAVLALVGVLWLWRRWRRRRGGGAAALPAHVVALRALQELRGAPTGSRGEMDAFCVRVSQVLRTYVEARFGVHAPERTSEEFLAELDQRGLLAGDQRQALREFLQQCDLVKFAAVTRSAEVLSTLADTAENLIEATCGAPAQPSAAEGAA